MPNTGTLKKLRREKNIAYSSINSFYKMKGNPWKQLVKYPKTAHTHPIPNLNAQTDAIFEVYDTQMGVHF